jgi:hypothetical protein
MPIGNGLFSDEYKKDQEIAKFNGILITDEELKVKTK